MRNTIRNTQYAILITLILAWLVLPQTVQAAEYYLDAVNGDDANPGTSAQPWKTLNRAYTWYSGSGPKVAEGDTVLFRNGNYGQFKESSYDGPSRHFHRTNWITYKAATAHTPEFSSIYIANQDSWAPFTEGQSYLKFVGFDIPGGVYIQRASYLDINDCNIVMVLSDVEGYWAPYVNHYYGVSTTGSNDITVQNCNIENVERGVNIATFSTEFPGGNGCVVRNNRVHYIGEDGMVLALIDGIVSSNEVYDLREYRSPVNIYGTRTGDFKNGETVKLDGTEAYGIVDDNDATAVVMKVYQTTALGIEAEWKALHSDSMTGLTSGATISDITKVDSTHTDAITIQGGNGIEVCYNNLHRSYGGGADGQVLKFDSAQNVNMHDNLLVGGVAVLGEGWYGGTTHINHNTFISTGSGFLVRTTNNQVPQDAVIDEFCNNIVEVLQILDDTGSHTFAFGVHKNNIYRTFNCAFSITLDNTEQVLSQADFRSLFTNYTNHDYTLPAGSAAINFGSVSYGSATDILGNLRDAKPDAGCYEYGASTFLYGDVNGDGEIGAYDAALAARLAVGLDELTADKLKVADVNGDGEITAYDAALIAQKAVGLIDKFPVEN